MEGGADISECGRYRYRLWRDWRKRGEIVRCSLFVMLNPSTADAAKDDPTIRKCIRFAKSWGDTSLYVVNLFAWRSTSPRGLLGVEEPVGSDNDEFIHEEAMSCDRIVLAWGSHASIKSMVDRRAFVVRGMLRHLSSRTFHLGRAKDGNPRHPLMLPYATRLIAASE